MTFIAIILLKGLGLPKKILLRATLLLCLINVIAFNMYLSSNNSKEKTSYDYFKQTAYM